MRWGRFCWPRFFVLGRVICFWAVFGYRANRLANRDFVATHPSFARVGHPGLRDRLDAVIAPCSPSGFFASL